MNKTSATVLALLGLCFIAGAQRQETRRISPVNQRSLVVRHEPTYQPNESNGILAYYVKQQRIMYTTNAQMLANEAKAGKFLLRFGDRPGFVEMLGRGKGGELIDGPWVRLISTTPQAIMGISPKVGDMEDFVDMKFVSHAAYKGPPMDPGTGNGPLLRKEHYRDVTRAYSMLVPGGTQRGSMTWTTIGGFYFYTDKACTLFIDAEWTEDAWVVSVGAEPKP